MGVLFATRYNFMNDSSEVIHLQDDLIRAVQDSLLREVIRWGTTDSRVAKLIAEVGDVAIAAQEARNVIGSFYQTTFENSTLGEGFAVPYIMSFCSHQGDDEYVRKNGLLSQWRGYGGDERYAIVFRSYGLEELLDEESKLFEYPTLTFADVDYNDPTVFSRRYARLVELIVDVWKSYYGSNSLNEAIENARQPFVMAATRLKHRGFKEEREVRIIACPTFREFNERMHEAAKMPLNSATKYKELHHRTRSYGPDAPCIHLFDWRKGKRLPIERIIVGPHRNQQALKAQVERLTNSAVPVVCSQTPFVG